MLKKNEDDAFDICFFRGAWVLFDSRRGAMGCIRNHIILLLMLLAILPACNAVDQREMAATPTPAVTQDRLGEPPLPANPTQYEQGRHLYWLHCMPCHGDRGQGLTDEFRSLWEVDHQNCWARGCHAGRMGDEGFPLPRFVPAIISSSGNLPAFASTEALFAYLRTTHPPQNPGALSDEAYRAITAYVLAENGRLSPDLEAGVRTSLPWWGIAVAGLVLGCLGVLMWTHWRRKPPFF